MKYLSLLCSILQWCVWYGSHSDGQSSHRLWRPTFSPQCYLSNYDIIFHQDFSTSSHFTQTAEELDWSYVEESSDDGGCCDFTTAFRISPSGTLYCDLNRDLLVHVFDTLHITNDVLPLILPIHCGAQVSHQRFIHSYAVMTKERDNSLFSAVRNCELLES